MQTEESRKLVLDFLAAQRDGDREKARAMIHPEAEFVIPASVNMHPPNGPAGIMDY